MSFWKDRSVVMTGASGYLARRLSIEVRGRGARVHGIDMRPLADDAPFDGFTRGQLFDIDATAEVLRRAGAKTCFHLAGQSGVSASQKNPVEAFDANARAVWCFLEACRRAGGIEEIVFTSSNHVYGPQASQPTAEDAPLNSDVVYGASKACGDIIARCYADSYGVPVVTARITNSYGGEDPHTDHLIAGTIRSVLRGERPVIRGNGTAVKGWLYIEDTIDALIALAEQCRSKRLAGRAFNVAPGESITVRDTVQRVLEVMEREDLVPEVRGDPKAVEEREELAIDRITRAIGWRPKYSLEAGLRRAVEDYRQALETRTDAVAHAG